VLNKVPRYEDVCYEKVITEVRTKNTLM